MGLKRLETENPDSSGALYQDAGIFLFDDHFSAIDAHTGSHLFKVIIEGKIAQAGKYQEILESDKEFMELVSAHKDALSALHSISPVELDASSSNQKIENKMTHH
ncbi:ABC transporter C family member 7 [Carex littledalei]|uniref:ABC transporter C family member 7 n=1 Tax=Carex littledalei TaxID=544730 RepID=A0A833RVC2_9POAL|nr:ABC transporter C family member 7 [Carex littledalei]